MADRIGFLTIGALHYEKLAEGADAGHRYPELGEPGAQSLRSPQTLCGYQTDYLRGDLQKATRLITNTSVRMLRCRPTVSWTSGSRRSDNSISFAHP